MINTIGFFGDSFCSEVSSPFSFLGGYKTYMRLLAEHYDAKIVNVGHGGSSIWDTLLIQLKPFMDNNTVPDVCVFVWTIPGRLFNRKIRRLNSTDVHHKIRWSNRNVWDAAEKFYDYLYDKEKEEIEYISGIQYINNVILPQLQSTKIVHLWTAGTTEGWNKDSIRPSKTTYPHKWTHGAEIRPSLLSLSIYDNDISVLKSDKRPNHLDGKFKNELLFNWIKLAVDSPDSIWDYSSVIDTLYDKSQVTDPPAI